MTYPQATWRVIIHPAASGAMNMAIDEAIAMHVAQEHSPPTLRFYAWDPPCLSLGYSQRASEADFDRIHERGWHIVRRITGGRAILHTDEVTYSVALRPDDPRGAGSIVESYRRLSAGLLAGFERLGASVGSERADSAARRFKGPVCFEMPSDYEITAYGRKLVGSAQTRRDGMLLQHGALPLTGDVSRIVDALSFPDEEARETARRRTLERAITLQEAVGVRQSMARTVGQLMAGFAEALNLILEEGQLSEAEQAAAEDLYHTKYTTEEWLHHR
ncbi:MAG: biotin/lipoate A/B protein ligase family protein [Anaerolineae bacterium]